MSGCVSSSMLIGEPSQMDAIFLPSSLRPSTLAEELREDMEMDLEILESSGHASDLAAISASATTSNNSSSGGAGHSSSSTGASSVTMNGGKSMNGSAVGALGSLDQNHWSYTDSDVGHHHHQLHHHHHHHLHYHQNEGTTRILMDALVTTPTVTTRWYQASLTSILLTVVTILCLVFGHSYIRTTLLWLQEQDLGLSLFIFTLLFLLISFPLIWGYTLLLLAAGYLYGCTSGPLVVLGCGGVALAGANAVMRICCRRWFMEKFYSSKVESILQLINLGSGFKIVALTRLTPIPFGLQNALFSLSDMSQLGYLLASMVGLTPTAGLYCYMGSTLRSMEDVLSDQSNQITGYFIFGVQMLFTMALLCFVVRKARGELKKAMDQTSGGSTSAKACDIQHDV